MLLTLGKLYEIFANPLIADAETRQLVHSHLEHRWKKYGGRDREIFILAVVFNPYVKTRAFRTDNPALSQGQLSLMFARTFRRLMGQAPNSALMSAFDKYLAGLGRWSDDSLQLAAWRQIALLEVCSAPDLDDLDFPLMTH